MSRTLFSARALIACSLQISFALGCTAVYANPARVGQWSPVIGFPGKFSPIAAANLPLNRVVLWSANEPASFSNTNYQQGSVGNRVYYTVANFSSGNGSTTQSLFENDLGEMFCPGTTMTRDGSVYSVGGTKVNSSVLIKWNKNRPDAVDFSAGAVLREGRSYNSSVLLTDDSVFTIGGSFKTKLDQDNNFKDQTDGQGGEVLQAGRWRQLTNLKGGLVGHELLSNGRVGSPDFQGIYRSDNHAWLVPFEGGGGVDYVFHAGPTKHMHVFSFSGAGGSRNVGDRPDTYRMNGSVARISTGTMLITGGASSYGDAAGALDWQADTQNGGRRPAWWASAMQARGGALIGNLNPLLDGDDPQFTVIPGPRPRVFSSSVVMPGGDVFIVGGQRTSENIFKDTGAILIPEIYDSSTRQFSDAAPMAVARTYHSVALLLPDARVLVAGGGACPNQRTSTNCAPNPVKGRYDVHSNYEIFSPPYLFKGTRPNTPSINPSGGLADGEIDVIGVKRGGGSASDLIHIASANCPNCTMELIRYSSVTHGVNNDQLRVVLQRTGPGQWRIPESQARFIIGGRYMLFAISPTGVPSKALTVMVDKS